MAPYAILKGDVLLHLSRLARHTANIGRDARIGLMMCTPEAESDSPLALPRLSLSGRIAPVGESELPEACAAYIRRLPEAEPLFAFPDFRLFRLDVREVHWVGGFGKARSVSRQAWYRMFDNETGHHGDEA